MYNVSWKQIGRIAAAIVISTIVIVGLFSLYIFAGLSEVFQHCYEEIIISFVLCLRRTFTLSQL